MPRRANRFPGTRSLDDPVPARPVSNKDLMPKSRRTANAAVALRVAGASYDEVALTLGYTSPESAREAVESALAATGSIEGREALRREEAARLERLLRSVWDKALDGDSPEHLPAVKVAVSLIDRHIRLLGLDAPQEVAVYTPAASEIERWVNDQLSQVMPVASVQQMDVVEGLVMAVETD